MRFAMIIISALACYFLCGLDQQKKSNITVDKQRWPKTADKRRYLKYSLGISMSRPLEHQVGTNSVDHCTKFKITSSLVGVP